MALLEETIRKVQSLLQDKPVWGLTEFALVDQWMQEYLHANKLSQPILPIPSCLHRLRAYQQPILGELLSYLQSQPGLPRFREVDVLEGSVLDATKEAWRVLMLRIYGQSTQCAEHFPQLMNLIGDIQLQVPTIMISVLEPFKIIPPHHGYYCGVLRYHLGLIVPPECSLWVDGKECKWDPDIYFDDTYLHSVANPTNQYRMVLLMDIVRDFGHKDLNNLNRQILERAKESPCVQKDVKAVDNQLLSGRASDKMT